MHCIASLYHYNLRKSRPIFTERHAATPRSHYLKIVFHKVFEMQPPRLDAWIMRYIDLHVLQWTARCFFSIFSGSFGLVQAFIRWYASRCRTGRLPLPFSTSSAHKHWCWMVRSPRGGIILENLLRESVTIVSLFLFVVAVLDWLASRKGSIMRNLKT